MLFGKKVEFRLIIISSIFMVIFILSNLSFVDFALDKCINLTCNVFYEEASNMLVKNIELLKTTTERIASDKVIINMLDENRNFKDISEQDTEIMLNEINRYEGVMETIEFVEAINIASVEGDFLFSKGNLLKNFELFERPWFNENLLKNKGAILTPIHKDFNTGKNTTAIVSFIYSKDNTLLGAVVLDIFVEDLLEYIDNSFSLGTLKTLILRDNKKLYSKDGEKLLSDKNKTIGETYTVKNQDNILHDENDFYFIFNKDSIRNNEYIEILTRNTFIALIIIGFFISAILCLSINLAFKPALKSIKKLKQLLNSLDEDSSLLENKNEFKQLELISDTLGKSFDSRVQELIYYDELTKLPNRKKLKLLCDELISNNTEFALIFIDLNKFKLINDIHGHSVGDKLLIRFGNIMQNALKDKGILTRYSGDEFIIVYKDFKSESEFIEFYESEVLTEFNNPIYICDEVEVPIEFSTGIAVYPKDAVTFEELINKSDFMMYKNKNGNTSKNISFFNNDTYSDMMHVETIKNELKYICEKREINLVYQPIYDQNKQIKKAEALLRWNSPKLGFIPPNEFIKFAEETKDIINIGYYVINEACKYINENNLDIDLSINISPIQLMEPDFAKKVNFIIDKYGIDYKKLYFEITESVLLEDNENVHNNIEMLRKKGIQWSLDDFGTGYASFNYLTNYSLDILKIDKIFLDKAHENNFKIISSIKEIATTLNIKVVIEGVETEDQFESLKKIKCDLYQGYYLSKPLSGDDLIQLVKCLK